MLSSNKACLLILLVFLVQLAPTPAYVSLGKHRSSKQGLSHYIHHYHKGGKSATKIKSVAATSANQPPRDEPKWPFRVFLIG